jgi:preprotein translocase subunit SecD
MPNFTKPLFASIVAIALTLFTTSARADPVFVIQVGEDKLIFLATDITKSEVTLDSTQRPAVSVTLSNEAGKKLADFTTRHINKDSKMIVCGVVIAEPIIIDTIAGGDLMLAGSFIYQEAKKIADSLKFQNCNPIGS